MDTQNKNVLTVVAVVAIIAIVAVFIFKNMGNSQAGQAGSVITSSKSPAAQIACTPNTTFENNFKTGGCTTIYTASDCSTHNMGNGCWTNINHTMCGTCGASTVTTNTTQHQAN